MSAGNAEAYMPSGNPDMYTAGYTVDNNNTVTGNTAETNNTMDINSGNDTTGNTNIY